MLTYLCAPIGNALHTNVIAVMPLYNALHSESVYKYTILCCMTIRCSANCIMLLFAHLWIILSGIVCVLIMVNGLGEYFAWLICSANVQFLFDCISSSTAKWWILSINLINRTSCNLIFELFKCFIFCAALVSHVRSSSYIRHWARVHAVHRSFSSSGRRLWLHALQYLCRQPGQSSPAG